MRLHICIYVYLPLISSKIMILQKGQFKKPKQYTVQVDIKTSEKLRHLAHINKLSRNEIIKQAIDLYEKVNIFS